MIVTSSGNDKIFAGEGADIIHSGTGNDFVDLSEAKQEQDKIVLGKSFDGEGFDTVYGFSQGILGDIIDITDYHFLI